MQSHFPPLPKFLGSLPTSFTFHFLTRSSSHTTATSSPHPTLFVVRHRHYGLHNGFIASGNNTIFCPHAFCLPQGGLL
jgi:hypothetical protein